MKASELISRLQDIIINCGDLEVQKFDNECLNSRPITGVCLVKDNVDTPNEKMTIWIE